MRTKVIFIIIFLLTMAFLPIIISKCSSSQTAVTSNSTADKTTEPVTANEPSKSEAAVKTTTESVAKENSESEKSPLTESDLCGMVAAKYNENYCEETLKALTIILYTNYIVSPDSYDLSDIEICLPESKAENSVKENYNKIKSAVSSVYKSALRRRQSVLYTFLRFYQRQNFNEQRISVPYRCCLPLGQLCKCR